MLGQDLTSIIHKLKEIFSGRICVLKERKIENF